MSLLTYVNRRMEPTHNGAAEIKSGNMEQQKYEWHHGAAEIRVASQRGRNNRAATQSCRNNGEIEIMETELHLGAASLSGRNRKSLAPLFTKLWPSRQFS
jgi:hypothetical protein